MKFFVAQSGRSGFILAQHGKSLEAFESGKTSYLAQAVCDRVNE
jgi:hypothetical protein